MLHFGSHNLDNKATSPHALLPFEQLDIPQLDISNNMTTSFDIDSSDDDEDYDNNYLDEEESVKEFALASRTSDIMSNYRDYLADIDAVTTKNQRVSSELATIRESLSEDIEIVFQNEQQHDYCMNNLRQQGVQLDSSYELYSLPPPPSRPRQLSLRQYKKRLAGITCLVLCIMGLIATMQSGYSLIKEQQNLAAREEELAEELLDEARKQEQEQAVMKRSFLMVDEQPPPRDDEARLFAKQDKFDVYDPATVMAEENSEHSDELKQTEWTGNDKIMSIPTITSNNQVKTRKGNSMSLAVVKDGTKAEKMNLISSEQAAKSGKSGSMNLTRASTHLHAKTAKTGEGEGTNLTSTMSHLQSKTAKTSKVESANVVTTMNNYQSKTEKVESMNVSKTGKGESMSLAVVKDGTKAEKMNLISSEQAAKTGKGEGTNLTTATSHYQSKTGKGKSLNVTSGSKTEKMSRTSTVQGLQIGIGESMSIATTVSINITTTTSRGQSKTAKTSKTSKVEGITTTTSKGESMSLSMTSHHQSESGTSTAYSVSMTKESKAAKMNQSYSSVMSVSNSKTSKASPGTLRTIVEIAESNADLSTFVATLKVAGLMDTLSGEGPFTVLAPTNAAFAALPMSTLESLSLPENREMIQTFLHCHIIIGSYPISFLTSTAVKYISHLNGDHMTMHANMTSSGLLINDEHIIQSNIPASNGFLHLLDTTIDLELPSVKDARTYSQEVHLYLDIESKYKPKVYERSTGWTGQTFPEAAVFCASHYPSDGVHIGLPCPYEVYCPEGANSLPYGGYWFGKDGNSTYAPIFDFKDKVNHGWIGYVQLSPGQSCVAYPTLVPEPTLEQTGHLMCCKETNTPLADLIVALDLMNTSALTIKPTSMKPTVPPTSELTSEPNASLTPEPTYVPSSALPTFSPMLSDSPTEVMPTLFPTFIEE